MVAAPAAHRGYHVILEAVDPELFDLDPYRLDRSNSLKKKETDYNFLDVLTSK